MNYKLKKLIINIIIKNFVIRYFKYLKTKRSIIQSGIFDEKFYLLKNDDVRVADINPIKHYIMYGRDEGRLPSAHFNRLTFQSSWSNEDADKDGFFGPIDHYPLVSIVSVNYNGANDLPVFLDSLLYQSYKNFEVIIIDNNSEDLSEDIIIKFKSKLKSLKYIKKEKNFGFADGNNQALPYCKGELIALLNVDTRVDQDWLKELVDALSLDPKAAAVTSKTLFFKRFQDVEIIAEGEFSINPEKLEETLTYEKYFIRNGRNENAKIKSLNHSILLSLPIQPKKIEINFNHLLSKENYQVSIKIGKRTIIYYTISSCTPSIQLDLSSETVVNGSYIINNAGSVNKNGMPADRGFGEYDQGQFDEKCYLEYFCACSVLLRRMAIIDRNIFVPEFFAYFEDSELARWFTSKGYKILYAPRSIVYHRHSSTSSEGSDQWKMLVERSRAIFTYNGNYSELEVTLKQNEKKYFGKVNLDLFNSVVSFNQPLINRLHRNNLLVEPIQTVGIYNNYWKTYGGGEKHALYFATIMQRKYTVYLISENNFNIDDLSSYFDIDLSNCRKIVEPKFSEQFTYNFHIFINSTFQSNLFSKASKSYYIVSFPQKKIDREIIKCYHFLFNSDYTKKWAEKYWGTKLRGSVIYPIGGLNYSETDWKELHDKKQKIILSVGRFFVNGHSKNQHLIAKSFRKLINKYDRLKEWKLVLIGSLNFANKKDVRYYNKIKSILKGLNYEIVVNANRELLDKYYYESYIYVHATGCGKDPDYEPENFEHFGITPLEAMLNGCYPIVYHLGGPADVLNKIDVGSTFDSFEDLGSKLYKAVQGYESGKLGISLSASKRIREFLENNSLDSSIKKL